MFVVNVCCCCGFSFLDLSLFSHTVSLGRWQIWHLTNLRVLDWNLSNLVFRLNNNHCCALYGPLAFMQSPQRQLPSIHPDLIEAFLGMIHKSNYMATFIVSALFTKSLSLVEQIVQFSLLNENASSWLILCLLHTNWDWMGFR